MSYRHRSLWLRLWFYLGSKQCFSYQDLSLLAMYVSELFTDSAAAVIPSQNQSLKGRWSGDISGAVETWLALSLS